MATMNSDERFKARSHINLKAYIFSAIAGSLLAGFIILQQVNPSQFNTWYAILIQGVLLTAVVVPFAAKGWCEDNKNEEVFSDFADHIVPDRTSFTFDVPALPYYQRIHSAPERLGMILVVVLLTLALGSGPAITGMMSNNIPFAVFCVVAAVVLVGAVAIFIIFIAVTAQELRLRHLFHTQTEAGFKANGYTTVRPFTAEYPTDRRVLLREATKDIYTWWDLSFDDGGGTMTWANTRDLKKTKSWNEMTSRITSGDTVSESP